MPFSYICYISGSSIIAGIEPGFYIYMWAGMVWYRGRENCPLQRYKRQSGLAALPQLLWSLWDKYIILFNFTQYLLFTWHGADLPGTELTSRHLIRSSCRILSTVDWQPCGHSNATLALKVASEYRSLADLAVDITSKETGRNSFTVLLDPSCRQTCS